MVAMLVLKMQKEDIQNKFRSSSSGVSWPYLADWTLKSRNVLESRKHINNRVVKS